MCLCLCLVECVFEFSGVKVLMDPLLLDIRRCKGQMFKGSVFFVMDKSMLFLFVIWYNLYFVNINNLFCFRFK
ncbi:hypothetical protein L1887_09196 [Cichorium endivia]|nr:hypothetical protein L1887_09196 [Cichorium endivia]